MSQGGGGGLLCRYKDALGVPGKGVHSYRVMNVAIVDVIMTLIGAFIFARLTKFSFLGTAITFFVLGIVLHRLFCVRTTVDKLIFPNAK